MSKTDPISYYFEISLLKSPLANLTYQSNIDISIGQKVKITLANRKKELFGVVIKKVQKPNFKTKEIVDITTQIYNSKMIQTAEFISKYYICSLGEALGVFTPFDLNIKQNNNHIKIDSNIQLSKEQTDAFLFTQNHKQSLLFANTSSGKTEIYIKAIEKVINQNKQALLLIPEISLSPQIEQRLKKVFKDTIAIWHSKIQTKTKLKIVEQLQEGKIKIIAGARSALFLPYTDLGLIVVDEEHDDSYKSEQKPRLNVKDLSIYISSKFDTQTILGSATPSLSSFYKIPYFRLKKTYFESKKNIIFQDRPLELNQQIIDQIEQTLNNNKQIIIFLPTRANFKYQICKECGLAVECPFCSVGMSLHKNSNALKCHYCNYTQAIPQICPSCKTGTIENYRLGTAEVYTQLAKIFPKHTIGKFDRDSIKTNKELKSILKQFNQHKIDILVGTQMLSKGHDYHNVSLAVVLGIDSVLAMTNYKVREKALSLLIQIAGRSGRKGFGEVLVQTKNSEFFHHYMQIGDYEDFLKDELKRRVDLYPPYKRLARVIFSHKNHQIAKTELNKYINLLQNYNKIELIGFGECSVFKIANRYRYELLIRSNDINALLNSLHSINSPIASIDMDTLY